MDYTEQFIRQYNKLSQRNQGRVDWYIVELLAEQTTDELEKVNPVDLKNVIKVDFTKKKKEYIQPLSHGSVKGF